MSSSRRAFQVEPPLLPQAKGPGGGAGAGKNVVVRLLKEEQDIEAIMPLCAGFHEESRYRNLPIKEESLKDSLRKHCVGNPGKYGVFIAELGGRAVGFLACAMSRIVYTDYWSGSVLAFYVLPSCRETLAGGRVVVKLLSHYRAWARGREALEIQVHVRHGFDLDRINKFFGRMGFRLCGGNYSLELPR